jgi:hypothetical protein
MWADPIEGAVTGEYFRLRQTLQEEHQALHRGQGQDHRTLPGPALQQGPLRRRLHDVGPYEEGRHHETETAVVREMFYKHIPFRKEIREQLENMPAFTQSPTATPKCRTGPSRATERRFKKSGCGGELPGRDRTLLRVFEKCNHLMPLLPGSRPASAGGGMRPPPGDPRALLRRATASGAGGGLQLMRR